tara:strand:- start:4609 stop:4878 length:270 start_codon:yes stop_codon:yes gene_type:complete
MDEHGSRVLLAAVIEQAVHDRRKSITRGLIDEEARVPVGHAGLRKDFGMTSSLHFFFYQGGLEIIINAAAFNLDAGEIRRASGKRREIK